jgi:transcriptional regulator with XRE-family HTH domain
MENEQRKEELGRLRGFDPVKIDSDLLRTLLTEKGWRVAELAEKAIVARAVVFAILADSPYRRVQKDTLLRIAEAFGVPPETLVYDGSDEELKGRAFHSLNKQVNAVKYLWADSRGGSVIARWCVDETEEEKENALEVTFATPSAGFPSLVCINPEGRELRELEGDDVAIQFRYRNGDSEDPVEVMPMLAVRVGDANRHMFAYVDARSPDGLWFHGFEAGNDWSTATIELQNPAMWTPWQAGLSERRRLPKFEKIWCVEVEFGRGLPSGRPGAGSGVVVMKRFRMCRLDELA